MTTRQMKVLRRGTVMLGVLFVLACLVNAYSDRGVENLKTFHGR